MENIPEFNAEDFDLDLDFDAIEREFVEEERERRDITAMLNTEMDRRGIQRILDSDSEQQSQLQRAYIESIRERETEKLRVQPGGEELYIRGEYRDWVALACYKSLFHQVELHAIALAYGEKLIYAGRRANDEASQFENELTKKMAQGFLLATLDENNKQDREVYELFSAITPGESINSESYFDQLIIAKTENTIALRRAQQAEVMAITKQLVGLQEDDVSSRAATGVIFLTAIMIYIPRAEQHERADKLRELGSEYELDDEVITKLIDFYVETVPQRFDQI
jgi:hypothetical protein